MDAGCNQKREGGDLCPIVIQQAVKIVNQQKEIEKQTCQKMEGLITITEFRVASQEVVDAYHCNVCNDGLPEKLCDALDFLYRVLKESDNE